MKTIRRRRKENKTNYNIRMNLLKSGMPRVVFRKTDKYIIGEYVTSDEAKDKVVFGITSKILLKNGWPEDMKGSLKSLSASYLTGFIFGKEISEKKLQVPVLDIGMTRNVAKGRVFAFVKGIIDSGIKMKSGAEVFPSEERINGKNMKKDFSATFIKIKSKIEGK
ncbi:MAG: 50S ribosomal protein L18 [Candidatus Pacearchaeota archaeon]|jgi:large subunit ribosomal protein L18